MFKLVRYLKPFKKEVILGPIFKLTEAIFELIVPLVMARIIDIGVKNSDLNYVLKMGLVMILLGVIGLSCALTCQYFAAKASQGFGTIVRNDLFSHINTLSHAEIDQIGTPSLITRLTNDVNQLQLAVAMLIRLAVRVPFLIIGSAVMAMMLDIKLSLIFFIVIPIITLTIYLIMSKSIPYYRVIQAKLDRISLITRENLEGVRVIRAFSKQKNEAERFNEANEDLLQTSINVGKISALLNPLTYVIMNFVIIVILWCGGIRVDEGILTQGQIIAFVNYMTQILLALVVLANLVVIFTKASASATRVNEIFNTHSIVVESIKDNKVVTDKTPKITFKDVCFSYGGSDEEALSHISFSIEQGETIGVIGGTGSGKSTLINLLARFYDVTQGEVLIDGINVKDYSFEKLRQKIGLVPQKVVLFSGTLRENLKWADEDATDAQIEKALKIAQAYEFVEALPEKYDTYMVQDGKNLSGGQRQRLTIARALVRNPEILILDDSASALDFATEARLRKALKEETKEMTVLMISQRVSTIKNADKILVLDDGELVGIGSHQQLIEKCDVYKEICLSQLSNGEV